MQSLKAVAGVVVGVPLLVLMVAIAATAVVAAWISDYLPLPD